MDDWEMRPDVQEKVKQYWDKITDETLNQYADIDGYWQEFYQMFGFGYHNVDYLSDLPAEKPIPSLGLIQ